MKLKTRAIVLAASLMLLCMLYSINRHRATTIEQGQFQEAREATTLRSSKHDSVNSLLEKRDVAKRNTSDLTLVRDERSKYMEAELKRLSLNFDSMSLSTINKWPWPIAELWVSPTQIYPEQHPELASILFAMSSAKIIKADVLPKGTQLKLLFVLEGNQKVVFKQKRYERDYVVEGKPYDGFDRHNGEIASFHLDRIFNFRRSPLTVGRTVNLRSEVLPVATEKLKKTFLTKDGNLCYYGVCYYCKEEEKACADGDVMEGAVTLWLPEEYSTFTKLRHPYQRTYVDGRKAKWETNENYCESTVKRTPPYNKGRRLLDIADACVFDYLIGNADRHHYEVFKNKGDEVMLLLMDNAKSFGNPHVHEPSVLAPLRQCCILSNSTWVKLHHLQNGVLTELLETILRTDPIAPVLHPSHYKAMNERLPHLIATIEQCIRTHGRDEVLVNEWNGL